MWLEIPFLWIGLINGLGIPLVHVAISWAITKVPFAFFQFLQPFFKKFPGETSQIHNRLFYVKHWKSILPDAGPWFGGFAKKNLLGADEAYLREFHIETIRSEVAHLAQWIVISTFVIWTPMPWAIVILVYAILSNFPCVVLQRQNRLRIETVLQRSR